MSGGPEIEPSRERDGPLRAAFTCIGFYNTAGLVESCRYWNGWGISYLTFLKRARCPLIKIRVLNIFETPIEERPASGQVSLWSQITMDF